MKLDILYTNPFSSCRVILSGGCDVRVCCGKVDSFFCLFAYSAPTLKIRAVHSTEMSVNFSRTIYKVTPRKIGQPIIRGVRLFSMQLFLSSTGRLLHWCVKKTPGL
jgi:hypothetical protein